MPCRARPAAVQRARTAPINLQRLPMHLCNTSHPCSTQQEGWMRNGSGRSAGLARSKTTTKSAAQRTAGSVLGSQHGAGG